MAACCSSRWRVAAIQGICAGEFPKLEQEAIRAGWGVEEATEKVLAAITASMKRINISYDGFTWESTFVQNGTVDKVVEKLKASGIEVREWSPDVLAAFRKNSEIVVKDLAERDADFAAVGKFIFQRGNSYSGVPACASCHGASGHGTQQLPRLAGQHPAYLEIQLKEFSKRERTNDNAVMHTVAAKLTELETRAVSIYIGGLQ